MCFIKPPASRVWPKKRWTDVEKDDMCAKRLVAKLVVEHYCGPSCHRRDEQPGRPLRQMMNYQLTG